MNHAESNPRFAAVCVLLKVFAQASALSKPCKSSFDNPTLGQNRKALLWVFFHDFQTAPAVVLHPLREWRTAITAVSPHQLPRSWNCRLQKQLGPVSFLDVGRMNANPHQQAHRIHQDVTLAAFHVLGFVIALWPPFSVVLTLWLSKMTALGCAMRPALRRTSSRRASCRCSSVPSRRQRQ